MADWGVVVDADWQVGSAEPNGFKSVTAFYPDEEASGSNGIRRFSLVDSISCSLIFHTNK